MVLAVSEDAGRSKTEGSIPPNKLVILIHSQFCGRFLFDYFSDMDDADDADKDIKNLRHPRHPRQSDSKYKFSDKFGGRGTFMLISVIFGESFCVFPTFVSHLIVCEHA